MYIYIYILSEGVACNCVALTALNVIGSTTFRPTIFIQLLLLRKVLGQPCQIKGALKIFTRLTFDLFWQVPPDVQIF